MFHSADRENPVFTNCPSDIAKTKAAGGGTTEAVSWDFPTFKDNSGYAELLHATHKPGDPFPIGPIVLVRYTARDYSGNVGKCEFHVKIEGKRYNKARYLLDQRIYHLKALSPYK